tara:strand:+ start:311 stop:946 length:636 start_codon:yes stop_codon:yes gene_type:complete
MVDNTMIITGVDSKHEDLVYWWYKNIIRHMPETKVGIWDFGMTPNMREQLSHLPIWLSEPTPHQVLAWFHKVKAVRETPSNSVAWLDVDCEVLTNIEDVFDLVPPGMIGLTRDIVRANWWATGVIVVNDRPPLLEEWDKRLQAGDGIRGDQEALHDLINIQPHEQIIELPQDYQWLRIALNKGKDSPTKKIIHWTGPKGKEIIRKNIHAKR